MRTSQDLGEAVGVAYPGREWRRRRWLAAAIGAVAAAALAIGSTGGGGRPEAPLHPPETQLLPFVTLSPPVEGVGSVDG